MYYIFLKLDEKGDKYFLGAIFGDLDDAKKYASLHYRNYIIVQKIC